MEARSREYIPSKPPTEQPPHEIDVDLSDIEKNPVPSEEVDVDVSDLSRKDELAERRAKEKIKQLPDYTNKVEEVFDVPPMPHDVKEVFDVPPMPHEVIAMNEVSKHNPPPIPNIPHEMKISRELAAWMNNGVDSFAAFSEEQGIPMDKNGNVTGWRNKRKLKQLFKWSPALKERYQALKENKQLADAKVAAEKNPMSIPKPPSKLKKWMQRIGLAVGLTGAASGAAAYETQRSNTEHAELQKQTKQLEKDLSTDSLEDTVNPPGSVEFSHTPSDVVDHMNFEEGIEIAPVKEHMQRIERAAKAVLEDGKKIDPTLKKAFDGTTPSWKQERKDSTDQRMAKQ